MEKIFKVISVVFKVLDVVHTIIWVLSLFGF